MFGRRLVLYAQSVLSNKISASELRRKCVVGWVVAKAGGGGGVVLLHLVELLDDEGELPEHVVQVGVHVHHPVTITW